MNNPNSYSSPALRIEVISINCIVLAVFANTVNRNLLIIAESLTAEQRYALLYYRLILLILYTCRNAQSITTITDGTGNVITGGSGGGKSHISYKPYGEIHRTDSSGPDVSRFKYTGQEEDKESGLLYYKARYYDPVIGRFLQADSMAFPERIMGMNRYMYVEGNPVRYGDSSGHNKTKDFFSNLGKDMAGGAEWAAKSIKGGAEWASGGLHRAQDKYEHEKFQATGTRYQRGPWARQHRRVFGKKQGNINNKFWNDLLYEGKIDPETAIKAWGGSLSMMGNVALGIQNLPTLFAFNFHQFDGLLWPVGGYVLGGTHNFSTGKWDERAARRGGALGACYAVDAYTAIVTLGSAYPGPNGGTYTPWHNAGEILNGMSKMGKFAGGIFSLFNGAMGVYGAGNGENCEGFAKQAFPL